MRAVLALLLLFYGLVPVGGLAATRGRWARHAMSGLDAAVHWALLPALLVRVAATSPIERWLNLSVLASYAGASLLVALGVVALAIPSGRRQAALDAWSATTPSTVAIGAPLLVAWTGPVVAGPLIACVLIDGWLFRPLCLALALPSARPGAWAGLARDTFVDPAPWACAIGILIVQQGWMPPATLLRAVDLLAQAALPASALAIGARLMRGRPAGPISRLGRSALRALPLVAAKLLLQPLGVFLIGDALRAWGAALQSSQLTVLVLVAALPTASTLPALSRPPRGDPERLALVVWIGTVLSLASFGALALATVVRTGAP